MNLREAKQILIDNGYIIEGTRTDLESAKLSTIAITLYEKFIEMMPDNFYMINAYDKLTNGLKLEFDLSKDLLYKGVPLRLGFNWEDKDCWAVCVTYGKNRVADIYINLNTFCRAAQLSGDDPSKEAMKFLSSNFADIMKKYRKEIIKNIVHEYRHYIDYANKYYGNKEEIKRTQHSGKVDTSDHAADYANNLTEINAHITQEIPDLIDAYSEGKLDSNDDVNTYFKKYMAQEVRWDKCTKETRKKISGRLFKIISAIKDFDKKLQKNGKSSLKDGKYDIKQVMQAMSNEFDIEADEKQNTGKHYIVCPNCGYHASKKSKFCEECGEKLA